MFTIFIKVFSMASDKFIDCSSTFKIKDHVLHAYFFVDQIQKFPKYDAFVISETT